MENKKTENIGIKAGRFVVEQAEKAAPKAKLAIEDWQRVYMGFVNTSFQVQKSVLKSVGMESEMIDQFEKMVKSATETTLQMQKDLSNATIEMGLNAAKSILEKTEKA